MNRRDLLGISTAIGLTTALPEAARAKPEDHVSPSRIRAIALDAFTVFDPTPVQALVMQLFPERGAELLKLWRLRQFEYTWLRTLMHSYADFWKVTEDALIYAARTLQLELGSEARAKLMQAWLQLKAYPDAAAGLQSLREAGVRLRFLSNMTPLMLESAVKNSDLDHLFEPALSTDAVRAFKPDSRAYRMAIHAFGLKREEIAFAAFGAWDAAGAKTFGYTTFWVNRQGVAEEELEAPPDATGADLNDLAAFIKLRS
jgi:2-haloacid dehalogenase